MLSKSVTNNKFFWHDKEITESEYNRILEIIRNKPNAPDGFAYRLTNELEWELYEEVSEEVEEI